MGGSKEKEINRADENIHKAGGDKRTAPGGARGKGSDVGNETKANMKGAQEGQPTDSNPLRGAVRELHSQHPIAHHDHGPHHGTTHHHRHEPLHGLKAEHHEHHAEKHSPSHREKHGR